MGNYLDNEKKEDKKIDNLYIYVCGDQKEIKKFYKNEISVKNEDIEQNQISFFYGEDCNKKYYFYNQKMTKQLLNEIKKLCTLLVSLTYPS